MRETNNYSIYRNYVGKNEFLKYSHHYIPLIPFFLSCMNNSRLHGGMSFSFVSFN